MQPEYDVIKFVNDAVLSSPGADACCMLEKVFSRHALISEYAKLPQAALKLNGGAEEPKADAKLKHAATPNTITF